MMPAWISPRHLLSGVALSTSLLFAGAANADPSGGVAAQALFLQAREALAKKDYAAACTKFRESDRLDPAIGTKFNLANCEELRGNLSIAWALFREVAAAVPETDPRHSIAVKRGDELEGRVPRLKIVLADGASAGATITSDGIELGTGSLGAPLPLEKGEHKVVVTAPGHAPKEFVVVVAEGETKTLIVTAGAKTLGEATPAPVEPGAPGASPPEPSPVVVDLGSPPAGDSSTASLGYALGGVGIAGLAVGGIAGVMALDKKSTSDELCLPDGCEIGGEGEAARDSAQTLSVVSTVGWVVGAVGIGAGVYFILTSDDEETRETVLRAGVVDGGPRLTLNHRW